MLELQLELCSTDLFLNTLAAGAHSE
jgi:hypothetical protein